MQETFAKFSFLVSWSNVTKISGEIFPNVFHQFSADEAEGRAKTSFVEIFKVSSQLWATKGQQNGNKGKSVATKL